MSYRDSGVFFLKNMVSRAFIVLWYTVCLVVLVVQHKAHPYSAASASHFCLHCLAPLHQQPQSEPSIISLTNTHNTSQYSSLEASHIHMEWKYGKNPSFFLLYFFLENLLNFTPAASPRRLLTFRLQLCVCVILWGTDFSERKWKGLLAEEREKERDQRVSDEADNRPVSQHHQPTHPAASRPSQKSTRRSHYCPPSSVFTGMLKIVITLVRTEIFNLDVFVEGLWPSCGEGRQSQRETDSGTDEERCNRIWTEMRTGSARSCSVNTLQIRMLNFCYTH